ncbi:MAG: hypothetical protein ABIO40_06920 [Devosia sp.]
MSAVNYAAPADLYPSRAHQGRRSALRYRRFDTAAEAVRFAMEELPPEQLNGTLIEIDEDRFDAAGIGQLYRSAEYPLPRIA